MTSLLRRYLVLAALCFWQGGFTFYSAVVVHVGHQVLGSRREQGFVTRRVTNYLNLAGALALAPLASDTLGTRGRLWNPGRWASLAVMAATLAVLVWMHMRLDALLDPAESVVLDRSAFRELHRWYLHISTTQWIAALIYLLLSLGAWRACDRAAWLESGRPLHPAPAE